jgi:hypothetical protein
MLTRLHSQNRYTMTRIRRSQIRLSIPSESSYAQRVYLRQQVGRGETVINLLFPSANSVLWMKQCTLIKAL